MSKPKPDEPSQLDKFKALARELDAPLNADQFDQAIRGAGAVAPPTKEQAFQAKREGKAD